MDEADSIFVDEAKTPLIIANHTAGGAGRKSGLYLGGRYRPQHEARRHFTLNLKKDKIELTDAGRHMIRYSDPPTGKNAKAGQTPGGDSVRFWHAHY